MTTTNDTTADWLTEFFGEPIHVYTRAQALADGVLIDAGPLAREAGFVWPVAYTAAAHAATITWDTANGALQDETGRAWDVLWMAKFAVRAVADLRADRVPFGVYVVPNRPGYEEAQLVSLDLVAGPGDQGEPVLTVCLRGED
ncbi:MAG TPA: DUF6573 family protein [Phototrophicaceae bacterium]|nr:DUF6573 family protein [Phototrophicaceae bacterium]